MMKNYQQVLFTCFFLLTSIPIALFCQDLDTGLEKLKNDIANEMSTENKQKIAVIEFSDLNGNITELGQYISEELITRLFMTKKFKVIERQLMTKIISEYKLSLSGIIDGSDANKIGKILGVDAICSGTITELGNKIKINSRLISTETGSIFAVASAYIDKDPIIDTLLAKKMPIKLPDEPKKGTSDQQGFFIREDFSKYKDGEVPPTWLGTEHCIVKTKNNKKVLTTFEAGPAILKIPDITFPENFKLKWIVRASLPQSIMEHVRLYFPDMFITIGNFSAGIHSEGGVGANSVAFINKTEKAFNLNANVPIMIELKKSGEVFRLIVDGNEMVIARFPSFNPINTIVLNLWHANAISNRDDEFLRTRQSYVDLLLIEGLQID